MFIVFTWLRNISEELFSFRFSSTLILSCLYVVKKKIHSRSQGMKFTWPWSKWWMSACIVFPDLCWPPSVDIGGKMSSCPSLTFLFFYVFRLKMHSRTDHQTYLFITHLCQGEQQRGGRRRRYKVFLSFTDAHVLGFTTRSPVYLTYLCLLPHHTYGNQW